MNIYCQFHNNGFRTYKVYDDNNLKLEQTVTSEDALDYPSNASVYMNNEGGSFVYKYIGENTLMLSVTGIPSIKHDTYDKAINSAFQIIASRDEEDKLNKIAQKIKSDKNFNDFFRDLFTLRGGLHIEGHKLYEYMDEVPEMECGMKPEMFHPAKIPVEVKKKNVSKLLIWIGILLLVILMLTIMRNSQK